METVLAGDTVRSENRIATEIVDAAFRIYRKLGPGLLESAYESVLVYELVQKGLRVDRQVPVPLVWEGLMMRESFRADLIIDGTVLIELKSVEMLAAVHRKQTLTYLRITGLKLGLIVNFGAHSFGDCIHRVVNGL